MGQTSLYGSKVRASVNVRFLRFDISGALPSDLSYYTAILVKKYGHHFDFAIILHYIANRLRVFKWTGRNDYIALCEPDYISFGGG